jgi:hypothetical protein
LRPAVLDAIIEAVTDKESSHVGSAYLLVLDQWDPTSPTDLQAFEDLTNRVVQQLASGVYEPVVW